MSEAPPLKRNLEELLIEIGTALHWDELKRRRFAGFDEKLRKSGLTQQSVVDTYLALRREKPNLIGRALEFLSSRYEAFRKALCKDADQQKAILAADPATAISLIADSLAMAMTETPVPLITLATVLARIGISSLCRDNIFNVSAVAVGTTSVNDKRDGDLAVVALLQELSHRAQHPLRGGVSISEMERSANTIQFLCGFNSLWVGRQEQQPSVHCRVTAHWQTTEERIPLRGRFYDETFTLVRLPERGLHWQSSNDILLNPRDTDFLAVSLIQWLYGVHPYME